MVHPIAIEMLFLNIAVHLKCICQLYNLPQLKVQVNTSFLFLLHEIMLCKLVHDDVFHYDQMLKNQELNLEFNELYMM
jgi:hypothetical protein